ncbi:hypothetical protein AWB80_08299 [Caballeronia pedi]|uniref:Uncharacterized protein n=2 Tax=Caballeronia pedi TaxID=1777141 RepID=A0A158E5Z8_9BURK|nr:hypothetical protein AWB80_08299 [Caballeronia pedi]
MSDPHAEEDYATYVAKEIERLARNMERLCEARLKSLSEFLCCESEPYPRAHLTTLRRPIHFLAMQAISPKGHPSMHPQSGSSFLPHRERLARYLEAVEGLNAIVAEAVGARALIVRSASTGIPLQALPARAVEPARGFISAIRCSEAMRSGEFHDAAKVLRGCPLLDHLPHSGVAIRLVEFDEWSALAGIAEPSEVTRLLQMADDEMWQRELKYHAVLQNDANSAETEEERAAAASDLNRLRSLARAHGRLLPNVTDGNADKAEGGYAMAEPPPMRPATLSIARQSRQGDAIGLVTNSSRDNAGLRIGRNSKASVDAYIKLRARELYDAGRASDCTTLATIIATEMQTNGWHGERRQLSASTVAKAIPAGLTGGRSKNGRRRP